MISVLLSLIVAQSQPAVIRTTPASNDLGMVVRQAGIVPVNCTNCGVTVASDGGFLGVVTVDGGFLTANQGVGQDGGAWNVSVNNPLYVYILDGGAGGSGGTVNQGLGQDGGLWGVSVVSANIVDTNNSTTTPLGAGATFTGTGTDVTSFSQVSVFVYSDRASATNGLKVQFSADNVNWYDSQNHTLTAATVFPIAFPVASKFARVVFTNGALAQTTFTLQTILKPIPANGTVTNLSDVPTALDQGLVTQSLIFGEITGISGGYRSVKVNPSGALTVAASQDTTPWLVAGRDGGALQVSGTWVPDGGSIGSVVQGPGQDGGAWNVAAALMSEGTVGSAVPAVAVAVGASDDTGRFRVPLVFNTDTVGTQYTLGASIVVPGSGGGTQVSSRTTDTGSVGLATWRISKFVQSTPPATTAVSCATTATAAPTTARANRVTVTFQNPSTNTVSIFLGGSGVTIADGLELIPGASFTDDIEDTTYFCRVAAGTATLRVLEN
jgi:hypothetical protein